MTGRSDVTTPSPVAYRLGKEAETRWRVLTPRGRLLICGIHETRDGYDVCVNYVSGESIYARSTFELDTARDIATELRATVLAKAGFREIRDGEC